MGSGNALILTRVHRERSLATGFARICQLGRLGRVGIFARMQKMTVGFGTLCLCAVLQTACGGSSASTPTTPSAAETSTTFQGTVAGSSGQTGTLDVTVQAKLASLNTAATLAQRVLAALVPAVEAQTATVAATGTLHIAGGATTTLAGTYDPSAKTVSLSGGGYSFTGSFGVSGVLGTYVAPGSVTGGFSALSTSGGTVSRYCGTYEDSAPDINSPGGIYRESGVWNVQISASGAASGTSTSTQTNNPKFPPGGTGSVTGQVVGNVLTLVSEEGGRVTGTISNGSVSGSMVTPSGRGGGTFSGSTGACQ